MEGKRQRKGQKKDKEGKGEYGKRKGNKQGMSTPENFKLAFDGDRDLINRE